MKKLVLKKDVIARLADEQMRKIQGGATYYCTASVVAIECDETFYECDVEPESDGVDTCGVRCETNACWWR